MTFSDDLELTVRVLGKKKTEDASWITTNGLAGWFITSHVILISMGIALAVAPQSDAGNKTIGAVLIIISAILFGLLIYWNFYGLKKLQERDSSKSFESARDPLMSQGVQDSEQSSDQPPEDIVVRE
jgi:hypothetical protein